MATTASALGTTQPYIPLNAASQLGRLIGVAKVFATLAALNLAVDAERTNVTNTSGIWGDNEPLGTMSEWANGFVRAWSNTGQHARTVVLAPGVKLVLPSDASNMLAGTAAPTGATGVDGDGFYNSTTTSYYTRAGGVWTLVGTVSPATAAASAKPPVSLPYSATVSINSDTADSVTVAAATGAMLVNVTGTPVDHQRLRLFVQQDATGNRVFTLGSMFALPSGIASVPWDLGANKGTLLVANYLTARAKWVIVSVLPGI